MARKAVGTIRGGFRRAGHQGFAPCERGCAPFSADLWLSKPDTYPPPNETARHNALVCLGECRKRGFAPRHMLPATLGEREGCGGVQLLFNDYNAIEFLNNGETWVVFPADLEPCFHDQPEEWSICLRKMADDGIFQPLGARGWKGLVSWPVESSEEGICRSFRLVRELLLGRISLAVFVVRLLHEHEKPVDKPACSA
jgi:hypothetical protein